MNACQVPTIRATGPPRSRGDGTAPVDRDMRGALCGVWQLHAAVPYRCSEPSDPFTGTGYSHFNGVGRDEHGTSSDVAR